MFKGMYDPEGAQVWLWEIKKIFRVMSCTEEHKVLFGTRMLSEEVEDQWDNVRQRLEDVGVKITWIVLMVQFLENCFSKDVCRKEIEFLGLKRGIMTVSEYVAKFGELVKFCPHYNGAAVRGRSALSLKTDCNLRLSSVLATRKFTGFLLW